MQCMQKRLLLFQRTSSNRNAPLQPPFFAKLRSRQLLGVEETQKSLQNIPDGQST
jgi:hypothetical protein